MTNPERDLVLDILQSHPNAYGVQLILRLQDAYPDRQIVVNEGHLNIEGFAEAGLCTARELANYPQEVQRCWSSLYGIWRRHRIGAFEVRWQKEDLLAFILAVKGQFCDEQKVVIVARDTEIAEAFLEAVAKHEHELHREVMVFNEGYWRKSRSLYESIKGSTLENLVLDKELKDEILSDFRSFFDNAAVYERYGIPWKRGVLLYGDPGNGKTHMLKALVNMLGVNALYVRSFRSQHDNEEKSIERVFDGARGAAPCLLIFEDLDALITPKNRSYFLNEMDGFAANSGLFVVATTNHPEKLDPAIVDRPSRFDRKYLFALPHFDLRRQYLEMWHAQLQEELKLSTEGLDCLAAATEGFSFAYFKELWRSSIMAWMNGPREAGTMDRIMSDCAEFLRSQMISNPIADRHLREADDDDPDENPIIDEDEDDK